eukprot:scaffold31_cov263-Pinguiococcus_pyrenoidosus.AAC.39
MPILSSRDAHPVVKGCPSCRQGMPIPSITDKKQKQPSLRSTRLYSWRPARSAAKMAQPCFFGIHQRLLVTVGIAGSRPRRAHVRQRLQFLLEGRGPKGHAQCSDEDHEREVLDREAEPPEFPAQDREVDDGHRRGEEDVGEEHAPQRGELLEMRIPTDGLDAPSALADARAQVGHVEVGGHDDDQLHYGARDGLGQRERDALVVVREAGGRQARQRSVDGHAQDKHASLAERERAPHCAPSHGQQ